MSGTLFCAAMMRSMKLALDITSLVRFRASKNALSCGSPFWSSSALRVGVSTPRSARGGVCIVRGGGEG